MGAEERQDIATGTRRLEEATREGDERFRRLMADLQVGVLILGRRSEVLFANRAALALLGFSEEEVLGHTALGVGSLTVREDGSPFPVEEHPGPVALATGKPVRGVVIGFYRPAIKDRVWLLVSADPQLGPDGRPDQVVVTLSEITSRRRVEERLRESEARYRQLVEEAPDVIYRTDVRGYFTYVNPVTLRVTGYAESDLLGKHLTELVREDHRERVTTLLRSQLRERIPSTYDELVVLARDGREIWVGQNVQLILEGERPVGLQAVARDITDRKRVEEALETERRQLREIVTHAPVAMALLDRKGRYIAQSEKWRSYRSRTGALPEKYHEAFRRALRGAVVAEREDLFVRGDGGRVYLRWSLHPWKGPEGGVDGVVAVVQNIDVLVRSREAALQASRLKSALLANMSHELRTPLNGVLGMARLLLEGPLETKQRERAEAVAASGRELLAIVTGILEYAELEAGQLQLKPADVELRRLVREVVDGFADEAASKVLQLTGTLAQDLPSVIRGDGVRIGQVLSQLVANAVKFTETGYVRVEVLRDGEQPGARVRFEVEDTGIGVPPASLARLFEPFHQADSSTSRRHGGTGLGLAIARRLVEAMGGEIGVRPREGGGSVVFFVLPLEPVTAAEAAPRTASTSPTAAPPAQVPPLVLVVEDNPVNQKVTVAMLLNLGYRVEVAGNGLDALQACSLRSYDAILMDCQMPDMDGFKATAWIRQREAEASRRTPIIALTASMMPGDREKCLAAGMDDYLAKPVRLQTLDATLRRWMARPGPSQPVDSPQVVDSSSVLPPDHPLRVLEAQGRGRVVVEIIDLFLQTTPLRLDGLRQVLHSGDAQSLASVAHSLKGAALQLGARGMGGLCAQIQAEARSGSMTAVGPLLDRLETEYDAVSRVLESEGARLRKS